MTAARHDLQPGGGDRCGSRRCPSSPRHRGCPPIIQFRAGIADGHRSRRGQKKNRTAIHHARVRAAQQGESPDSSSTWRTDHTGSARGRPRGRRGCGHGLRAMPSATDGEAADPATGPPALPGSSIMATRWAGAPEDQYVKPEPAATSGRRAEVGRPRARPDGVRPDRARPDRARLIEQGQRRNVPPRPSF